MGAIIEINLSGKLPLEGTHYGSIELRFKLDY